MNQNCDPYAVEQATLRARLLSASAGFPPDAVDDLRQELLLDFLRRAPRFDEARGEWSGFVRGVMRNRAATLVVQRRRTQNEVLAGDLVAQDSENQDDSVLENLRPCDATAELDVAIDVRLVVRQLPDRLQRLASLLAEMPVHDVCLVMGKSRSRIYQMIGQLRVAFMGAGLGRNRAQRTTQSGAAPSGRTA